jgi:DNA-directed RNA polymerase I subunit RPA2
MPAASESYTEKPWSTDFDTARRQHLFANPPGDKTAYPTLAAAIEPHVNSFNAVFEPDGLIAKALQEIGTKACLDGDPNIPVGEPQPRRNRLNIKITDVFLERPRLPPSNKINVRDREIMPAECRERHSSYRGKLSARLKYRINNGDWKDLVRDLGDAPIMLRTNKCHLEKLSPQGLLYAKEETEELGGYFIVNGNEKLIRMLLVGRRNFPTAIIRPSYQSRGAMYTKFGVSVRSVRPDETSQSNHLHYLNDGNIVFRFSWRKSEYLVPLLLIVKALVETNDREIFEGILGPAGSDGLSEKQFIMDRIEVLLRTHKRYGLHGMARTRAYLGDRFRVAMGFGDEYSDEEAGTEFLRKAVLPHLGCVKVTSAQDMDKYRLLLFMARKLYSLAEGECAGENPDATSCHEILLGGFLYGMILKERLEEYLSAIVAQSRVWCRVNSYTRTFADTDFDKLFLDNVVKRSPENIGQALEYFLSTGNLVSPTGLDLQQASGFTVVAEKINFLRFISHFRMVHRGSFFAELRTTTVRKLLPESWGFLCPVHTPDGAPCGLLNHLSHKCKIATKAVDASAIPDLVAGLGVRSTTSPLMKDSVVVQLDGRILGFCSPKQARTIHDTLRFWKVEGSHRVPRELEIGFLPVTNGGQYPGIYMFSGTARMFRPVKYLPLDGLDYVGPLEQPFMSVAVTDSEIVSGESTHVEFDPTNILSILANQTPFSDFNQSPRNMYQCQMGKQTMGTYGTATMFRTDNKAYRLQTGQTPIVRPPLHNEYGFDNFPNGTNVVVAVISYTGYDMDDAMIINKSAHERGFGHGTIYKSHIYNILPGGRGRTGHKSINRLFGWAPNVDLQARFFDTLDFDGLPIVGRLYRKGDPVCASYGVAYDAVAGQYITTDPTPKFDRYKDEEAGFVEEVRLLGSEEGTQPLQRVSVKFRIPRSPVIGDKFSSRHGQKGVCSQKWPAEDMPFTESGIQPDVIINPHAFPSRMTIGMFVESLAGKSGALHGLSQDSTPFKFNEEDRAVDYFGHQLMKAGFNYHGNEPMYSGITGKELAADIYIGVVYYQRLRHMVNDKYQVRTTGPINRMTNQPVKGRKKGGGIRVGEMERDALLAHGTAFLLQDRLLNCSDYQICYVCRECGSFLGTTPVSSAYTRDKRGAKHNVRCRRCAKLATGLEKKRDVWEDGFGERWIGGEDVTVVAVPGVLRYLDVELAGMGIKMKFSVD